MRTLRAGARDQAEWIGSAGLMRYASFMVHFANGQGDGTFSSLDEARRVIERRAEYDPPPPGIFPAEIWQRTFVDRALVDERLVERLPPT